MHKIFLRASKTTCKSIDVSSMAMEIAEKFDAEFCIKTRPFFGAQNSNLTTEAGCCRTKTRGTALNRIGPYFRAI